MSHSDSFELSNDSLLERIELVSQNAKGEPLTWGATPLLLSHESSMQQLAVKGFISDLFIKKNRPKYISNDVGEYIETLNMARTMQRESRNTASYLYRGVESFESLPLEVISVIDRALRGGASPAELLLVAEILEIPTIELASLTHPYGQRIGLLKEMRPAVNEAIVMMGGTLFDANDEAHQPVYEVKGSDNHYDTSAMNVLHMTRKTPFGVLMDGTENIERSSFELLLKNIPSGLAEKIREIPYGRNWGKQVAEIQGLTTQFVPAVLHNDEYKIASPLSTTIVARNPELEKNLLSTEAKRSRQKALALKSLSASSNTIFFT